MIKGRNTTENKHTYVSKDGSIETIEEGISRFSPDLLEYIFLSCFRGRNIVETERVPFLPGVPKSFWQQHLHLPVGPHYNMRLLCNMARGLTLSAAVNGTQRADAYQHLECRREKSSSRFPCLCLRLTDTSPSCKNCWRP